MLSSFTSCGFGGLGSARIGHLLPKEPIAKVKRENPCERAAEGGESQQEREQTESSEQHHVVDNHTFADEHLQFPDGSGNQIASILFEELVHLADILVGPIRASGTLALPRDHQHGKNCT